MDKINIFVDAVWGDQISEEEVNIQSLIDACAKEYKSDENGVSVSNIGGWQSKATILTNPDFHQLFSAIQKRLDLVFAELLEHPRTNAIGFQNAWININNSGDYNRRHTHPGSILSGVFYVSAINDDGDLVFENPSDLRMYHSHGMMNNQDLKNCELTNIRHGFSPITGMLIIFPSWLPHSTQPVPEGENRERISISFNCSWNYE